ncbi:hypothetical protein, partial [Lentzea indica]|uniref:hypothetical protein n=1 Tax=Lentzea indica TaxID=2604800 RepID=UPI001CB74802
MAARRAHALHGDQFGDQAPRVGERRCLHAGHQQAVEHLLAAAALLAAAFDRVAAVSQGARLRPCALAPRTSDRAWREARAKAA